MRVVPGMGKGTVYHFQIKEMFTSIKYKLNKIVLLQYELFPKFWVKN
jgi:hypothetical protein